MRNLLVMLVLAGCQKDLVAELPDAAAPDATSVPATSCPTPTQPLAAGRTKVFLSTEGVTLTKGCGAVDNAVMNCSTLIANDPTAFPAFLPGMAGRDAYIAQIVSMAQAQLAPYSIDIVTTRPTSGDYSMVVLGGDYTLSTGNDPRLLGLATNANCAIQSRGVTLMFDKGTSGVSRYAYYLLDDIGIQYGLAPVRVDRDCMCTFDPECVDADACVFGVDVAVTASTEFACGRTTQDEPALLKQALGCR